MTFALSPSGLMQPSRVNRKSPFEDDGPATLKDPGFVSHGLKGRNLS